MFMMIFYFSRLTDLTYAKSAPEPLNIDVVHELDLSQKRSECERSDANWDSI